MNHNSPTAANEHSCGENHPGMCWNCFFRPESHLDPDSLVVAQPDSDNLEGASATQISQLMDSAPVFDVDVGLELGIENISPISATSINAPPARDIKPTESQEPSYERVIAGDSISYRCECGAVIRRLSDLRRHWRTTKQHGGPRFPCTTCGKQYTRGYLLIQHNCAPETEGRS